LASDKYVLGFICANVGIEMQRAGGASLDQTGRGTVLLLVLDHLFGHGAVNGQEVGDLMLGIPTPNAQFQRGIEAAAKIQAVASGRHNLQNDPSYLAAKEVTRKAGSSLDFITPSATEDSKIAGHMLHAMFYQHLIDLHKGNNKRPQPERTQPVENCEKAEDKVQLAHEIAQNLIVTQLDLGSAFDDEARRKKLATPYGLGYIFGFADALLQRAGLTDETTALAELTLIYVRIFGKEQGPKVLRASLDLQTDKDFGAGRRTGGGEVYKWLSDKSVPLGLADYLNP
jgi:hypothetical protein